MYNSYAIDTGSEYVEDYDMMVETEATTEVSIDSLLSNWYFVGGVSAGVLLLLLILFLLLFKGGDHSIFGGTPTLTIETPQKISKSETEEFTLDVTISSFGDAIYPAASMSISFDSSRLEFIGVEEGNVFIRNDGDIPQKLPDWSCNPEQCNKSGKINIMYLVI